MNKHITGQDALDILSSTENEEYSDHLHIVIHLKQRMKERNLTQMQLAEMSGVRQATISQLCRGHVEKLHLPSFEKIAAAMNITNLSQLLSFELESEIMSPSNPFEIENETTGDQ